MAVLDEAELLLSGEALETGASEEAPSTILYVASAQPLALTFIKWLFVRLVHVHEKTDEEASELLSERVHVMFKPQPILTE